MKEIEIWKRNWKEGVRRTPGIECPRCSRKTRSSWKCEHCKNEWTDEERENVKKIRDAMISKSQ